VVWTAKVTKTGQSARETVAGCHDWLAQEISSGRKSRARVLAVLTTATRLRISIAAVVLLVNALLGKGSIVLPWALLVVGFDVVAGFLLAHEDVLLPHRSHHAAVAATIVGAFAAGLSLLAGPGALPLFVIPLYRAGERQGRGGVAMTGGALAVGAGIAQIVGPPAGLPLGQVVLWGTLAVTLGVLAAWEDQITPRKRRLDPIADEAAVVLGRLAQLSAGMVGGLDQSAMAERILDQLPGKPGLRGVILAGTPDSVAIPIALRGASRVPWPEPREDEQNTRQRAWTLGVPGSAVEGDRAVVAVPLRDVAGEQVGMLVADWPARTPATDGEVAHIANAAERHATGLAVAMSYANLREQAGMDERRHLARAMHDGIAQEIAAVGFHLDMIRYAAQQAGDSTAPDLADLRSEVARILIDLRNDITDLRVGLRPEHGLGAAVSARLQQFGAATGAVVTVVLRESGFRLPASTEIRLYRLLLDVLADAQRHRADHVEVELIVAAPQFQLTISHSGATALSVPALRERLDDSACQLSVGERNTGPGPGSGVRVRAGTLARLTHAPDDLRRPHGSSPKLADATAAEERLS
jgi:signal transduction histidine kinase